MRGSVRSPQIFCLIGAFAALWLSAGPAWAGGGGRDAGTFQPFLDFICAQVGMTDCPQLPTVTQIILELSALQNTPPDGVRGPLELGSCTVSGNSGLPVCSQTNAFNAVNPSAQSKPGPLALSPIALAGLSSPTTLAASPIAAPNLSSLTPLAFISPLNGPGSAVPVPPGTNGANSFFYGLTTRGSGQPDTLTLAFDYTPQTTPTFPKGAVVANISLPLEVLKVDGSERLVCGPQGCPGSVALLQISANCNGGPACLTANVMGDFSVPGTLETRSATALGLQFGLVFSSSPNAAQPHTIFVVQVPLLVTGPANPTNCGTAINSGTPDPADCGNDPAYFGVVPAFAAIATPTGTPTGVNQLSGLPTAFTTNDLGFTPAFLGQPVGIAPYAAPRCVGGTCPAQPIFPFCASLWAGGAIHSAVAAFLSIGTDGTTYVSSPVPSVGGPQCPF